MSADSDKDVVLLAEYATAIAEERLAWQRWKIAGLNEAERASAYTRWKNSIEHARAAAVRLQTNDAKGGRAEHGKS